MKTKYVLLTLVFLFLAVAVYYLAGSLNDNGNTVVVYVSTDQDYAEPILADFENATGITVKAVYDTETTKTVGLVNRLLAEKGRAQADVFWNNEVSRSILLKERGVLTPYISPNSVDKPDIYKDADGYWTGFSGRARVLIYNTKYVKPEEAPKTLQDLADPKWRDRVGIANPLAGTTGAHVASLFALWGTDQAEKYFQSLKDNGLKVVESNGMIKEQVSAGDLYMGLADTDDANDAVKSGKPVAMIYPDQGPDGIGTLVMPNSVMLIDGAPHSDNGKKLIDYLLSGEVEQKLAESKAVQIPLGKDVPHPSGVPSLAGIKTMNVTQYAIYEKINVSQNYIANLLKT